MAYADNIVSAQQFVSHKQADIAENQIHTAIAIEIVVFDKAGKDMTVSKFELAQFIAGFYGDIESQ